MCKTTNTTAMRNIQVQNLIAANERLQQHMEKMRVALNDCRFSDVCAALRAISEESNHASRTAMELSLSAHLHNKPRFTERGQSS